MPDTTTIVDAGTIGGPDGQLSVSFMPEYNVIFLHATVPSDRRRAGVSIRLSDTAPLREIIDRLEGAIEAEVLRRAQEGIRETDPGVLVGGDTVAVRIEGSTISLSRALYDTVAAQVAEGKTVLSAGALRNALPWLGVAGALQVAQAVYEDQKARGVRDERPGG